MRVFLWLLFPIWCLVFLWHFFRGFLPGATLSPRRVWGVAPSQWRWFRDYVGLRPSWNELLAQARPDITTRIHSCPDCEMMTAHEVEARALVCLLCEHVTPYVRANA